MQNKVATRGVCFSSRERMCLCVGMLEARVDKVAIVNMDFVSVSGQQGRGGSK